jgi:uncharacterized membrane protein YbhN (UPF0104 family)
MRSRNRSTDARPAFRPLPLVLVGAVLLCAIYVVLPAVTGLDDAWATLRSGSKSWLVPAALAEAASFLGWALVLRAVLIRDGVDVGWGLSVRITLAGVAATRLLATAGAGGIALTVWAFRRLGMPARAAARAMATLLVALYAVYLLGLVLAGAGLRAGLVPGRAPISLTLVPAGLAAVAMLAVVLLAALSRVPRRPLGDGPMRWLRASGTAPLLLGSGLRRTARLAGERNPGLAGAMAWWAFDLVALWCSFRAFGVSPPLGALVMGYLLGQLGNLLPLPGGVGGIDGAMIGALIALGIGASDAVVAVLAYRTLSFWLPTLPGIAAYVGLRRDLDGAMASSTTRRPSAGRADSPSLRDLHARACGFPRMLRSYAGSTVAGRMKATATEKTPAHRARRARASELRGQAHAVPRDPTTPAERDAAPRGDDRSHTPPHGDALLPRRGR